MFNKMHEIVNKEGLQFETPLEKIYREGKENPRELFEKEKQEVSKEEVVEAPVSEKESQESQEPIAETEPEK